MDNYSPDGTSASTDDRHTSVEEPRTRVESVLVTGVGGIVGQGILKSLSNVPHQLVGVDASESAAGLYAVPKGYLVPAAKDPAYVDRILEICVAEHVRFLFPGLDVELPIFAKAAPRFRQAGVVPIISDPAVIDIADDKLETVRFLESHGLPAPRTWDLVDGIPSWEYALPLVLKPRKGGSHSQGVHLVESEDELCFRLKTIDKMNYVAQEYIKGDEYTCGTITFDGRCDGVIVMKRSLRDGNTVKATVVSDIVIEAHVRQVAEFLKPFGPCNFQLRVRDGAPYIFDINPRCSGTTFCRSLAGFNEPLMTLDFLENGRNPSFEIRPISIFRYLQEIVVENAKVQDVRRTGLARDVGLRL